MPLIFISSFGRREDGGGGVDQWWNLHIEGDMARKLFRVIFICSSAQYCNDDFMYNCFNLV